MNQITKKKIEGHARGKEEEGSVGRNMKRWEEIEKGRKGEEDA